MFKTGDSVDRLIKNYPYSGTDRWIEGYTVIEMPEDFVPLGDCIYVERDGHITGVPPVHLRYAVNPMND